MSKWTEVRDGFVSALDVNDVVDAAKNQMVASLPAKAWKLLRQLPTNS